MPPHPHLSAIRRLSPCATPARGLLSRCSSAATRTFYSSSSPSTEAVWPPPTPPPTRWCSDLEARIGKCIAFGCSPEQARRAAAVIKTLTDEWRPLTAGCSGFIASPKGGLEGQKVVWGEMDSFGHVNNVQYNRYAESSRVNWILNFGGLDPMNKEMWAKLMKPGGLGLIMKSLTTEFKFPMTYPDTISVYHKLSKSISPGATLLNLECIILSHQHRRIAATTNESVVVYDYETAERAAVPRLAFPILREVWDQQNKEMNLARQKVWNLIREVAAIEMETWNRAGAIEDMGSAATES
ncbi:thioesterase-like superfamily-domain-containing protein [Camillea tinctor]|nr:thioesterase-like superfamily-domain-containing protein [Camillea tinctor]